MDLKQKIIDVLYFHTQFYKASHELSVNFKDPKIKIKLK